MFEMKDDPVGEPLSSISTRDKGTIMGDSKRDSRNVFPSTLTVSLEFVVIVSAMARSGRDGEARSASGRGRCSLCGRSALSERASWEIGGGRRE